MESEKPKAGDQRRDAVRLVEVHSRLNSVMCDLFDLVLELNTDEALVANAMTDAVSWLHFDLGIAPKTARAWVRAARALPDLPEIASAFRAGSVSLDELLILCRFATPHNESDLLPLTRNVPVDELAAEIRDALEIPRQDRSKPESPVLRMWWDDLSLQLRGSIPGADGVLVENALLRLGSKAPLDPVAGLFRDPQERYAEAVIQMASESVAEDRDHDRATVVLHIGVDQLSDPNATVNVGGRELARDDLLRLTCDGRLQPAIDDASGTTVGVGRVSRQIPAWLRRLMAERDGGCRFPGCLRTRWTHGHHMIHWAEGGPTNLDNLITLCGFHHRLIHRQSWVLKGNPNADVTFINQWGSVHTPARAMFTPDQRRWLVDDLSRFAQHQLGLLAAGHTPP